MPRSRRSNNEPQRRDPSREWGSASLEFITLGVLLLVPLVYLVLALAAVQAGAFAAEGAARYAARIAVLSRDDVAARAAAERAAGLAFADFGLSGAIARATISCHPAGRCTEPGARVQVVVSASVPLPFVPDVFGPQVGSVNVEGVATQTVSNYAAVPR